MVHPFTRTLPERWVLAGTFKAAQEEAREHGLKRPIGASGKYYEWFVWVGPQTHTLEGTNILPGDSVIFGYGTTADMIDRFVAQADSRGTKLSDLRILTK